MYRVIFLICYFFNVAHCQLWSKGVVHFDINRKDYDIHSQEMILNAITQIEKEICIKFFLTPINYDASSTDKILFISNPDKKKTCYNDKYDFTKTIVNMPIGYKCLNIKDMTNIIVGMLRASIAESALKKKDPEIDEMLQTTPKLDGLLYPEDRNFINTNYYHECSKLEQRPVAVNEGRRSQYVYNDKILLTDENKNYYAKKLWPLGVVKYGIAENIENDTSGIDMENRLRDAIEHIENNTCVVFKEYFHKEGGNMIWFVLNGGEEMPKQGFEKGMQVINLVNMTKGSPAHHALTLLNVLRILGLPMESNRYDRANYLVINWNNIEKGKEQYFELERQDSWIHAPYDFESVTHAPVNYMCGNKCNVGAQTVTPIRDHLWQRSLLLGHKDKLSETDLKKIATLYTYECNKRNGRSVLRN